MELSLKNIKHYPSMSEETECFNAKLHINNMYVCDVKNSGRGGETECCSAVNTEAKALLIEAESWAKTLPDVNVEHLDFTYNQSLDNLIDGLLTTALENKELSKLFKTNLVWKEPNTPDGEVSMCSWGEGEKISDMLNDFGGPEELQRKIDELKVKGYQILNTNLGPNIKK